MASGRHRFKGHSIFVSDDNINPKDSLLFGSMLGQQLKARGLQYTPHYTESFMGRWKRVLLDADAGVYRYDTLFVLKKTQMSAVLLEAGSIANRAISVAASVEARRSREAKRPSGRRSTVHPASAIPDPSSGSKTTTYGRGRCPPDARSSPTRPPCAGDARPRPGRRRRCRRPSPR